MNRRIPFIVLLGVAVASTVSADERPWANVARNADAQAQAAGLLRANAPRAPQVALRDSHRVENSPQLSAQAQAASLLKGSSNALATRRQDVTVTLAKRGEVAGDAQAQAQILLRGGRTE
jgi:hypothetical protein